MMKKKRKEFLAYVRSDHFSFTIAFAFLTIPMEMLIYSGQMGMLDNAELTDRIKEFMDVFPKPIALHKQVIENMVRSEYNLLEENRANFLWDTQLMFNIGNHSVGGGKLYFVTDDHAMIRNAIANNARYSILTFSEYMAYIG